MIKKPETFLRLGLGLTYLYSGLDLVRHPASWSWAIRGLPVALSSLIERAGVERFLLVQGFGELLFAAILLLWFLPSKLVKWVAFLIAVEMALILWLVGLDPITFRDLGLLGAALALWLIYLKK